MGILSKLFGFGGNSPQVNIKELISKGASVVDVRTPGEYQNGHYKNSTNIPLDKLESQIEKIKKMKQPIITVCASGMRSGSATSILKRNGIEAYNGGSWTSIR